jgi:hypothetical protein
VGTCDFVPGLRTAYQRNPQSCCGARNTPNVGKTGGTCRCRIGSSSNRKWPDRALERDITSLTCRCCVLLYQCIHCWKCCMYIHSLSSNAENPQKHMLDSHPPLFRTITVPASKAPPIRSSARFLSCPSAAFLLTSLSEHRLSAFASSRHQPPAAPIRWQ